MPNLVNLHEVLTFIVKDRVFLPEPYQAYMRGGNIAQPVFGLKRNRPQGGQIWPRQEFPQRDKLGVL